MKRFFSLLMVCFILLCAAPVGVRAVGGAYLQGPSTVRAGDTISVTLYAGGGIHGGNGTISYDSTVLTYQSFTQRKGAPYAVEFGGSNFLFYDNSMKTPITDVEGIFSLTFTVKADVAPGTAITVKATGVTLSDGTADQGIGTLTYSTTVAVPLSGNCGLKSMTVTGANISPAFSASVTSYTASVPFATSKIDVKAVAEHEKAKVSIHNPTLTPGGTTNVQITVTAENGATKTYKIAVSRERDPNYVESSNADLKALAVEGYVLSPAFDKTVSQYYVWLPYETQSITLTAAAEDAKASWEIGKAELIPGVGRDIPVTVVAEDGTQKVYTVTAVRAPEHSKTEEYLNGQREELPPESTEPVEPAEPTVKETVPQTTAPETTVPETTAVAPAAATGYSMTALILAAVLGALAAAAVTVLILCRKRIFAGRSS